MDRGLVAVIVLGIVVALLPLIVHAIDSLYTAQQTQPLRGTATVSSATRVETSLSTTESTSSSYRVVEEQAVSHQGADTLIVSPAKVIASPGARIPITIEVLFRHTQPCPYSSWDVKIVASGGVKIVSDDGGKLVGPRTFVRHVVVEADSSGKLVVTYLYGAGCPYGTEEQVTVDIEVR